MAIAAAASASSSVAACRFFSARPDEASIAPHRCSPPPPPPPPPSAAAAAAAVASCCVPQPPIAASLRSFSLSTTRPARSMPSSSRFIGVLSTSRRSSASRRGSGQIVALDPDFYKIPYVEGVPVGTRLKLWNLPPGCDHGEMFQWLNSIPDVRATALEFTQDPDLNAQGVGGFVEFETKQQACMAIVRLDGRKFKGRCIRMDFVEKKPHEREIGGRRNRSNRSYGMSNAPGFEPRSVHSADSPPSQGMNMAASPPRTYAPLPSHRVFVGNLPWSMDDHALHSLFSSYGSVREARVMRDRETGSSRGFGFVAMSSAEEMNAAISGLDGKPVDGRPLKVNVASTR